MDNNSIDLGQIYGFNNCPEGGCVPTGNIIPNIPSLEQIAAYNQAQAQLRQGGPEEEVLELERTLREAQQLGVGYPATGTTRPVQGEPISAAPATGMQSTMSGTTDGMATTQANEYSMVREYSQPFPVTGESIQYLNGFMRTQIGRKIEIQMLVGSDTLVTKEGYLLGVGANYILINETNSNDLTTCDFYNIKFVRYFY